ncbi:hypothetical protein, partial [Komagataeibacter saccharivorans]|uniref:hypothetical protein n=1 Tax=Komagataeibacter saccharivorans TaxID=265959 RepID=UPI0024A97436
HHPQSTPKKWNHTEQLGAKGFFEPSTFFMLMLSATGTTTQAGFPSTRTMSVLNTLAGSSPMEAAAWLPV